MAISTTERTEIIELTTLMFNAAPGAEYLSQIIDLYEGAAGRNLQTLAVILGGTSAYNSLHPNFETAEEFAAIFLTPLGLQNDAFAVEFITTRLESGASKAQVSYEAYAALNGVTTTDAAQYQSAKAALDNLTEVAEYYSVTLRGSATDLDTLQSVVATVTADDASVTAAKASLDQAAGQTFTLTTGVDNLTGTSGNDTFNASNTTLTGLDTINGGAGADTLNLSDVAGDTVDVGIATITNVESLTLASTKGLGNTGTQDYSGITGLTSVTLGLGDISAGAQDVTVADTTAVSVTSSAGGAGITVNGGSAVSVKNGTAGTDAIAVNGQTATTSVTTTGGNAVDIDDVDVGTEDDTIATVSMTGFKAASTVKSDALTSLTVASAASNVTVTAAAGTRALNLTLNKVTGGTIADAEATALNVTATGAASSGITLDVAKAETISFAGDKTVSTALGGTQATDLAITVTNTAGVTISTQLDTDVTFTGGAGKDSIKLGATTETIAMGAGDDTVTVTAALGTGGTINAGDGTDTLSLDTAYAADTLSASPTFEGKISGFERLTLTTAGVTKSVNLANLDDISYVSLSGATDVTLNNILSGGTVRLTDTSTKVTAAVLNAATGTADSLNVIVTNAAAKNFGTVLADNVESVTITATDSATTPLGTVKQTLALTANAVEGITVTGNAGLALTNTSTTITAVDASGMTGSATTAGANALGLEWTTGALADAATITGSNGVDVIDATAALDNVVLSGGAGGKAGATGDTLTGGAGDDTISFSGLGDAILAGGAGADTISASSGDDTITGGAGADTLAGGAGVDTFAYTAVSDSQGVDMDVIVDFTVGKTNGDVIDLSAVVIGTATFAGTANGYGAVLTSLTGDGVNSSAVFDSSTSTLYIDVNADGQLDTNDMAIQLTGVTTGLVSQNFVF